MPLNKYNLLDMIREAYRINKSDCKDLLYAKYVIERSDLAEEWEEGKAVLLDESEVREWAMEQYEELGVPLEIEPYVKINDYIADKINEQERVEYDDETFYLV